MNDSILIDRLEREKDVVKRWREYYYPTQDEILAAPRVKPDSSINDLVVGIQSLLTAHPVFGQERNVFFGTKQLNLAPWVVARQLVRVAADRGGRAAIAWLHHVFGTTSAELRMVATIEGVEVQEPAKISNGVRLLPLEDAPDSPNLRMLFRRFQPFSAMEMQWAFKPAIAVVDIGIVAAKPFDMNPHEHEQTTRAGSAIVDLARAFTLADRGAAVVSATWTDFVDPELTLAELGIARMGPRFEGSLSHAPIKLDDEVLAWAERYLTMNPELRPLLDVALDRLNLARRRRSPSDKAIEACICLEAFWATKAQWN
jgi:hypothetical protein